MQISNKEHRISNTEVNAGMQILTAKKCWGVALAFTLIAGTVFGQQAKKIKTVEVSDTIVAAAVDRPGDLYITTRSGQSQRFDKDGKLLNLYRKDPVPTTFDPRDGARLMAFYRPTASYDLLNTAFDVVRSYKIDSAFSLEPWLATTSGDYSLWVLDAQDWNLKKVNVQTGTMTVEIPLPATIGRQKSDFIAMREYQGFLFILHKKEGIHIFNSMGKHLRTLATPGLTYFNFIGEELYYLQDNKLKFFDLFTADTRELTLPAPATIALLTDERLFLIQTTAVTIYIP
jgi:hypothetical protein